MTRVLLTRPLPARVVAAAEAGLEIEVRPSTAAMKPAEMRAALALYDGVLATLGDNFDADIFGGGTHRCKVIANYGVWFNHIDAAAARACGITVTNTPGAVTDATEDIGVTLMLMSARRTGEGERHVRAGAWAGWHPTQMMGLHVTGKTLGVIGMGRIGQAIARRCHFGFEMPVIYYNRSEKTLDFEARRMDSMEALAAAADVVIAAVPGSAETHHLIGRDVFRAMQPHAHFVNVGRGDVVQETALIAALQSGQIAGAGLDVYEHEPRVPDALKALENVVLLPHMGTNALEVREGIGLVAVDNLKAFFAGETPPNIVN